MPLTLSDGAVRHWDLRRIAVVGPGIVGMPMAALLAWSGLERGDEYPPIVTVVQRNSATSGWKVDAINAGRSPIGGIEPDLDRIVHESVERGVLRASHDYAALRDADVILICVQTDRRGIGPDYGPLFEALEGVAVALRGKPADNVPLIVFESTLAPSSMATLVREHFARHGLEEGRDILLGNSPNRVMPGRLVERVAASDKLVAGLHPATPGLIEQLYGRIVTRGTLHATNSMTAEVVKTLENAYRDVRIAYAAEVARWCDERGVDFFALRDAVNARLAQSDDASRDPNAVPSGGLLVPTVGVGGHCLPKDGILLWWRRHENGADAGRSLILEARRINDESPAETLALAERHFGPLGGRRVTLLGAAYRFDSEDTRNSPTLALAALLRNRGCTLRVHDPYVHPTDQNVVRYGLQGSFTRDLGDALGEAEIVFLCTGHRVYAESLEEIIARAPRLRGMVDGCNLFSREAVAGRVPYCGIGRGTGRPSEALATHVHDGFRRMERGVANELLALIEFLNDRFAADDFNRVDFATVQRLAGTCVTGCAIADPGPVEALGEFDGLQSRLVRLAAADSAENATVPAGSR